MDIVTAVPVVSTTMKELDIAPRPVDPWKTMDRLADDMKTPTAVTTRRRRNPTATDARTSVLPETSRPGMRRTHERGHTPERAGILASMNVVATGKCLLPLRRPPLHQFAPPEIDVWRPRTNCV